MILAGIVYSAAVFSSTLVGWDLHRYRDNRAGQRILFCCGSDWIIAGILMIKDGFIREGRHLYPPGGEKEQ